MNSNISFLLGARRAARGASVSHLHITDPETRSFSAPNQRMKTKNSARVNITDDNVGNGYTFYK